MPWKWREVQIEDDKSIADSGTETIDINVTEPISELLVRFRATNDSAVTNDQPPELQISKIEIVDGGQVYWSLTGPAAVAAAVYDLGKWPNAWYDESASVGQSIAIPILFGRYLGDLEYSFDPARLTNPQLKFTWADQALYLNDSLTLGVTARVMEGAPKAARCLMWKEIESFTTSGTSIKSIELPVDFPYRRLLIRGRLAYVNVGGIFTKVKLDCDVGKFIPFDLATSEFEDIIRQAFGPYTINKLDRFDGAGFSEAWMEGHTAACTGVEGQYSICFAYVTGNSYIQQRSFNVDGDTIADQKVEVTVKGYHPHSCWCYQFGLKDDPDTWFNAPEYGEVKLKLTQGGETAAALIAVQQPRTLP